MKLKKVIKRARAFAEPFCITDGDRFRLKDVDPNDTLKLTSEDKPRAKEALAISPLAARSSAGATPQSTKKRADAKLWAAFVLSGPGK